MLKGLCDLAAHARERSNARIVAVTGSVGKTTTKEAIRIGLQGAGEVHASIKSFNNHWGVPLMLARMPRDTAFGVFEIGMNHAGEITPLSQLVRPHVAVITSVAAGASGVLRQRGRHRAGQGGDLFGADGRRARPFSTPITRILISCCGEAERQGVDDIVTYGYAPHADVHIASAEASGEGMTGEIIIRGRRLELTIKGAGRHMLANAAAAIAVAHKLGVDLEPVVAHLRRFGAPEGRGAALRLGPDGQGPLLIDESYNANPASMDAALSVFAQRPAEGGGKVLVLGDMRELGPQSPQLHAGLAEAVRASKPDKVFLVGKQMQALADALGPRWVSAHAEDVGGIAELVLNNLAKGDVVMVKGSNGVGLSQLVLRLREAFGEPDRSGETGKGA